MPIPMVVARWNKVVLNKITRHIAPWMPGLGVVVHHGRRSGRRYETPVTVFTDGDRYIIALTYGPDTDWVRNVLASGGCELRTRGPGHPARLPADLPRRQPPGHPPPRTAGTASPVRRRLPVPDAGKG